MLASLRILGIVAWIGCLLSLAYQSLTWIVTATWPTMSLLSIFYDLLGMDLAAVIRSLPLDIGVKTLYVLATTELVITLWWAGVVLFILAVLSKLIRGK